MKVTVFGVSGTLLAFLGRVPPPDNNFSGELTSELSIAISHNCVMAGKSLWVTLLTKTLCYYIDIANGLHMDIHIMSMFSILSKTYENFFQARKISPNSSTQETKSWGWFPGQFFLLMNYFFQLVFCLVSSDIFRCWRQNPVMVLDWNNRLLFRYKVNMRRTIRQEYKKI